MYQLKTNLLVTSMIGIITLVSCESEDAEDVSQQKIETNYSLIYDEAANETTASASFKFGSTSLRLNTPSEVLFNDASLHEDNALGLITYERTFNGVVDGEFRYRNNDNDVYVNVYTLTSVALPESLTQVSLSELIQIKWIGLPIRANESISLRIWNDITSYYVTMDDINATTLQVRGAQMPVELLGQCTIQVDRTFEKRPDQAPDKGGSGKSQWNGPEYSIMVVE
ncbi:MAG: hypothetical protein RIC35_21640 [Marinoscillum sp.]